MRAQLKTRCFACSAALSAVLWFVVTIWRVNSSKTRRLRRLVVTAGLPETDVAVTLADMSDLCPEPGSSPESHQRSRAASNRWTRYLPASTFTTATKHRKPVGALSAACAAAALLGGIGLGPGSLVSGGGRAHQIHAAEDPSPNASLANKFGSPDTPPLAEATSTPEAAPPTLAAAVLSSHEIFGFAPYWTLAQQATFNVSKISTLDYFAIGINANGTVDTASPGWNGYQSQDLVDLINRAHQAGDRVVLTINCFSQAALDSLTSNPSAGTTIGHEVVGLLEAKNMDGVNVDFEGEGSADHSGLDVLMSQLSSVVKSVDPHWQVTMDTYASSASDTNGFYDIRGLARSVDAFFVMAYDMRDPSRPSANSPLSGPRFNVEQSMTEYTSVVPPSKVVLGLPWYGYDWPTAGPGMGDPATGPPTPVPYSAIAQSGYPTYWDPTTQTAWTSYQVGSQWYQIWYDNSTSLALKTDYAATLGIRGVGIWSLGMGDSSGSLLAALLGGTAPTKDYAAGPGPTASTATSTTTAGATGVSTEAQATREGLTNVVKSTWGGIGNRGTTTTTSITPGNVPTTVPVGGPPTGSQTPYAFSAVFQGLTVQLSPVPTTSPVQVGNQTYGQITAFQTDDPEFSCLEAQGLSLPVTVEPGGSTEMLLIVDAQSPGDCTSGQWTFTMPMSSTSESPPS